MIKKSKTEKDFFNKISTNDAFSILKILAKEDTSIARRIEQIARDYLSGVDIEAIASEVYFDLDNIENEEVWDRSGRTRHGYVDPTEMAWEMFEEALEPFLKELKKYQELSMHTEAKNYCVGLLKGIYQFEKKSKSDYKDYIIDAPSEYLEMILNDWKKRCNNPEDVKEVEKLIKKNFPS